MWPHVEPAVCAGLRWPDGILKVLRGHKRQLGVFRAQKMLEDPRQGITTPACHFQFFWLYWEEDVSPKGSDVVGTFLRRPGDNCVLGGGCRDEGIDLGGSPDRTSLVRMQNQEAGRIKDGSVSAQAMDGRVSAKERQEDVSGSKTQEPRGQTTELP